MSRQSLLALFTDTLSRGNPAVVPVQTTDITGPLGDVLQTFSPIVALDGDRLTVVGWKTVDGRTTLHVGCTLFSGTGGFIAHVMPEFRPGYNYLGAVYRAVVNGRIATFVATTPEGYADQLGYQQALRLAVTLAGFDGTTRHGTRSNTINLATPSATNLLVMEIGGKDITVPQIPDLQDGDTVTRFVGSDGRVLQAKVGGNKVFRTDAGKIVKGDESIWLAFTTNSPIIDIGKPTNLGGFQVMTTTAVLDAIYDTESDGYVIAKTTEIGSDDDRIDIACMGASADGSFNFTRRNASGGKSEILLVPANQVPDEIAAPWKMTGTDDTAGFSSSTVIGTDPISQDAGAAS